LSIASTNEDVLAAEGPVTAYRAGALQAHEFRQQRPMICYQPIHTAYQRSDSRYVRPWAQEPAAGQDVEDLEHRFAAGVHRTVRSDDVDLAPERISARHRAQVGPVSPLARPLERDEFEPVVAVDRPQLAHRPAAERALEVEQDGQPSARPIEE
jgi:hypothetical protein